MKIQNCTACGQEAECEQITVVTYAGDEFETALCEPCESSGEVDLFTAGWMPD